MHKCMCSSGMIRGHKNGNIQNPCPYKDMRKTAYKSYRIKFSEYLKMAVVLCEGQV